MNKVVAAGRAAQRKIVLDAVLATNWSLKDAARSLGISNTSLMRYLLTFAPVEYQRAKKAGLTHHGGFRAGAGRKRVSP